MSRKSLKITPKEFGGSGDEDASKYLKEEQKVYLVIKDLQTKYLAHVNLKEPKTKRSLLLAMRLVAQSQFLLQQHVPVNAISGNETIDIKTVIENSYAVLREKVEEM